MFITTHFTLEEMVASQVASREGLDNTPSPEVISNLGLLCQALEQVRSLVAAPIIVSSGYRSERLNRRVGGSVNSAHRLGLAADFTAIDLTPRELARAIKDSSLMFDQLILEFGSWVHLGVSAGRPRRQVLTINRGTGYLPGLQ
ncbi:D-Ala-D-Ala carboxypeptidase family metallohydrolase [Pseudomonas putida]